MQIKRGLEFLSAVLFAIIEMVPLAGAAAPQFAIRYAFTSSAAPAGNLVRDASGILYGTTSQGGAYNYGTVYKVTPNKAACGHWSHTVLHNFTGRDGATPQAGVIFDESGNLYGTTSAGGAYNSGTVFKLQPNLNGTWKETVLHSFTGGADGSNPEANVIFDAAGNLFGTTVDGGSVGIVFELQPNSDGTWSETVIHDFDGVNGAYPFSGLTLDSAGNLYGTASVRENGIIFSGVVFKLARNMDETWTYSVIYAPSDLYTDFENNGLTFDAAGNLYGTAWSGGPHNYGFVFKLAPSQDGTWTESVLKNFMGPNGAYPSAGLVFDSAGNLYGTASMGGAGGYGVVFKLTPNPNGTWAETMPHTFWDVPGAYPSGGLVFDQAGNAYGVALGDGTKTFGSVYEIVP